MDASMAGNSTPEDGGTVAFGPAPAGLPVRPTSGVQDPAGILHLENLNDELRIYWRDGLCSEFLALWLRDNALPRAGGGVGPGAGMDPGYLPDTLSIAEAVVDDDGRLMLRFLPEDITCGFATPWLRRHGNVDPIAPADPREPWDAGMNDRIRIIAYRDLCADTEAMRHWLHGIRVSGIGLLRGLPPTSGMMLRVMERFSFPRRIETGACFAPDETLLGAQHHCSKGGRGLHTAAPYRDPVPTLRALHCVRPKGHGGQSVVVDGLFAADLVARQHPSYFSLLKQYTVPFERREGRFHMRMRRPLVSGDHARPVRSIHYDPLNTAPLDLPGSTMRDFYSAYCCFSRTLNRIDLRVELSLASGDMLVMDNRRVLYGEMAGESPGVMESCYADWDGSDSGAPGSPDEVRCATPRMTLDQPCHRDGAADADRIP